MESCSSRICKALQMRNMKQVDLSEKTGIPKSAISQYCSGAFRPKQKRLFLIAQALEVDEAWLMGLDVPMDRQAREDFRLSVKDRIQLELTTAEEEMIRKFRRLDDRGQSAVLNVLEHEYAALPGDKASSAPRQA